MRIVTGFVAALAFAVTAAACAQVGYSNRPQDRYGDRYDPRDTIVCSSEDMRFNRCRVRWRDARLVQQISGSACIRGRTWGFERDSIWVDQGCRARFAAAEGGWYPPAGWDRRFVVACGSPQYKRAFCQVDVGGRGRVFVHRQISDTRCVLGRNWGWNRAGIWVDRGCSAQFMVDRRW